MNKLLKEFLNFDVDRFFFIIFLLSFIILSIFQHGQIAFKGCGNFNTYQQMVYLGCVVGTAYYYGRFK